MRRAGGRVLLLLAGVAAGCAEGQRDTTRDTTRDPSLALTVAVSPTPATVGSGRVLLALVDSAGAPLPGATLTVTGRPPGGGPTVTDTAVEEAPGRYAVPAFPFAVPGDWTLDARALLPDGRSAAASHRILVVGPPRR